MSALLVRHSHGTIMPAAFEHVCEEVYSHCGSLAQLAAPRRAHGVPFDAVFEALIFGATGACHRREERRTRAVLEAPSVESRVRMQPVWVGGQGLRGAAHHESAAGVVSPQPQTMCGFGSGQPENLGQPLPAGTGAV